MTTINSDRLWGSLMELAKIGATPKGGVRRLALTELDGQARDLFIRWCKEAGCIVTVDGIGNIFARRPGKSDSLPPIITGSHIDTQPSGGKLKQRVIEKKKAEMQDYVGEVKSLLALYMPPNPQKIQAAMQAGNASISRDAAAGLVNLVFKNYAQPGDQMTIAFDPAAKKIANVNVNTYTGQAKDAVTLMVNFSSLPDGTNYAEKTVLNMAAKQMLITTVNTNYRKL